MTTRLQQVRSEHNSPRSGKSRVKLQVRPYNGGKDLQGLMDIIEKNRDKGEKQQVIKTGLLNIDAGKQLMTANHSRLNSARLELHSRHASSQHSSASKLAAFSQTARSKLKLKNGDILKSMAQPTTTGSTVQASGLSPDGTTENELQELADRDLNLKTREQAHQVNDQLKLTSLLHPTQSDAGSLSHLNTIRSKIGSPDSSARVIY